MTGPQLTHTARGVAITQQALSPKQGDTRLHTLWWTGPDPTHPRGTIWTTDPEHAAVWPTEPEAADAFTAVCPREPLPPPQLQLEL